MEAISTLKKALGKENAKRYSEHQSKLYRAAREKKDQERKTIQGASDFIRRVSGANYLNMSGIMDLMEYLDFHCFAPLELGCNGEYQFILTPCTAALIARDFEQATGRPVSHEVDSKPYLDPELPEMILGINMPLNYQIEHPSNETNPGKEILKGSKPELEIFVQLGVISCYPPGQGKDGRSDPCCVK